MSSDSISGNLQLLLMGEGLHVDDWSDFTNQNMSKLETAISGQTVLTLTGGSLTLTDDQVRSQILYVNGTFSAPQTLIVPQRERAWIVVPAFAATGAFPLTIKTAAGGGATVAVFTSGEPTRHIYCDSGNVIRLGDYFPPNEAGFVKLYAGGALPANYLYCAGQAVSRTTFANLFAAIGTFFGAGDGSSTFNVPDLRGRVPAGVENMGGAGAGRITTIAANLGSVGGEEVHTLGTGELPAHNHPLNDPTHNHALHDPGHFHVIPEALLATGPSASEAVPLGGGTVNSNTNSATTGITIDAAATGITMGNTGGGAAHNNIQPTLFLNFIIHI